MKLAGNPSSLSAAVRPISPHLLTPVCASCGGREGLEYLGTREDVSFCRDCIERSYQISEWDDLGEPVA